MLIEKVIEVDRLADVKVKNALKEKEEAIKNIEKEIALLQEKMTQKSEGKLGDLEECLKKDVENKVIEIRENSNQQKKQMDKIYDENKDKWVSDIFDKLISM